MVFAKVRNDRVERAPRILTATDRTDRSGQAGGGKLRFVEYGSGRSVWGKNGKGVEIKGTLVDHAVVENGILVTTGHDSTWANR